MPLRHFLTTKTGCKNAPSILPSSGSGFSNISAWPSARNCSAFSTHHSRNLTWPSSAWTLPRPPVVVTRFAAKCSTTPALNSLVISPRWWPTRVMTWNVKNRGFPLYAWDRFGTAGICWKTVSKAFLRKIYQVISSTNRSIDWLVGCISICRLFDWLIDWLIFSSSRCRLIDWFIDLMIDLNKLYCLSVLE